jgi:hypothetical protein
MPICLECGFETTRLQWTHFKYNCTGQFANGREYKKVYPDAKLVDDDLAKNTAVTESNLIKKYGIVDGKKKWQEYKQKQSYSNSYEYKKEKHGWTKSDFENFNKSRAVTLPNLIKKHGEIEGTIFWQTYCERQAYTNTIEYFIEKYGKSAGKIKYTEICKNKSHSIENICKRYNCDIETAVLILQDRIKQNNHVSQTEKFFVDQLENYLGCELNYSYKTKQYCVYGNNKANFYDIVHNNRAIEYNGDYWHCNPKIFVENYYHTVANKVAKDIWQEDTNKINLLKQKRNIECMVIWESDFLQSPNEMLEECKKWILYEKE